MSKLQPEFSSIVILPDPEGSLPILLKKCLESPSLNRPVLGKPRDDDGHLPDLILLHEFLGRQAAIDAGDLIRAGMQQPLAEIALEVAFSAPVLAVQLGPVLLLDVVDLLLGLRPEGRVAEQGVGQAVAELSGVEHDIISLNRWLYEEGATQHREEQSGAA